MHKRKRSLVLQFGLLVAVLAMGAVFELHAQSADASKQGEYTVTVHILATHLREICSGGIDGLCGFDRYADVVIDGRKMELTGASEVHHKRNLLVRPGDYKARLVKEVKEAGGAAFGAEYEVQLGDGQVWRCYTSGISE